MNTYVHIPHKHICHAVVYIPISIYTFLLNKFFVYKFPTKTSTFFAIYNFLITVFYPWQSIPYIHPSRHLIGSPNIPRHFQRPRVRKKTSFYVQST